MKVESQSFRIDTTNRNFEKRIEAELSSNFGNQFKLIECRKSGATSDRFIVKVADCDYYLKIYSIDGASEGELVQMCDHEFKTLEKFYPQFESHPYIHIPKPLFKLKNLPGFLMEYCQGPTLQEKISCSPITNERENRKLLYKIGHLIYEFQSREIVKRLPDDIIYQRCVEDYWDKFITSFNILITYDIINQNAGKRYKDVMEEVFSKVFSKPHLFSDVHYDFRPRNVILSKQKFVFHDFMKHKAGSIYFDPSMFWLEIKTQKIFDPLHWVRYDILSNNFLKGFKESLENSYVFDEVSFRFFVNKYFIWHFRTVYESILYNKKNGIKNRFKKTILLKYFNRILNRETEILTKLI